ncbi:MAG: hypothetical protein M3M84_01955 [Thermoproteota archaeon]|nr:hypothetical protein [Thermoproteota archaeon]
MFLPLFKVLPIIKINHLKNSGYRLSSISQLDQVIDCFLSKQAIEQQYLNNNNIGEKDKSKITSTDTRD